MSSGTRTARYSDSARVSAIAEAGTMALCHPEAETATAEAAEAADVPHVGPAATPPDLPACHPVAGWSLPSPRSRLHHLQNGGGLQKIYLKPTELPKCM